jgi:hypothetical protein
MRGTTPRAGADHSTAHHGKGHAGMKTVLARGSQAARRCRARPARRRRGPPRRIIQASPTASCDATPRPHRRRCEANGCSQIVRRGARGTGDARDASSQMAHGDAGEQVFSPPTQTRSSSVSASSLPGSLANRGWKSAIHSLALAFSRHFNRGCELA